MSKIPPTFTTPSAANLPPTISPSKKELSSWRAFFEKRPKPKEEEKNTGFAQGIFGVPLNISIKYAHVAISLSNALGLSYTYGYVPTIVAKCGVYLKEKATETEGIFRLAGAERRVKELQGIFSTPDTYGKDLDWTGYNIHDCAHVLRRYLNQLPEPIIPLEFYDSFRAPLQGHQAQAVGQSDHQEPSSGEFSAEAAIKTYQELITKLPPHNSQLLLYLLDLLAVFAAKADQSLMTASNLSSVFQPGILRHPSHDMSPREYRLNQDILIFLIENQDSFLVGMEGTEADEKTKRNLERSSSPKKSSPIAKLLSRSASTASATDGPSRRFDALRRNKSTSSKGSPTTEMIKLDIPASISKTSITPPKPNKLQKRRLNLGKPRASPQDSNQRLSFESAISAVQSIRSKSTKSGEGGNPPSGSSSSGESAGKKEKRRLWRLFRSEKPKP